MRSQLDPVEIEIHVEFEDADTITLVERNSYVLARRFLDARLAALFSLVMSFQSAWRSVVFLLSSIRLAIVAICLGVAAVACRAVDK